MLLSILRAGEQTEKKKTGKNLEVWRLVRIFAAKENESFMKHDRTVVLTGLMSDNGYTPLSDDALQNIFASSCIESAARKANVSPMEMYVRMKNVDLFKDLIFPCYESLHTQSREIVTEDVLEALRLREKENNK